MAKIGILGTTSWGTTLALVAHRAGAEVTLWARNTLEANTLIKEGENRRFLPGVVLPSGISITASADLVFGNADIVIVAVPSKTMRVNSKMLSKSVSEAAIVVSAVKGLEITTGKRMSEILSEELPEDCRSRICVLSGPNLASEIVRNKPASTVVGSKDKKSAVYVQSLLNSHNFKIYTNNDIVGMELGGALKNILAIGAGVCDGLSLGDNAKATLITRGLTEIARLGIAAGADPLTFAGLTGFGDTVATCASKLSRNHQVGVELAQGRNLESILKTMKHVAEGVDTTKAALHLANNLDIEMPILETTYQVLFNGMDVLEAVAGLDSRGPVQEWPNIQPPFEE